MTFKEAILYCQKIGIVKEYKDDDSVYLELSSGEWMQFMSNYEGDYSELTPGNGIEPPSCHLYSKKPEVGYFCYEVKHE